MASEVPLNKVAQPYTCERFDNDERRSPGTFIVLTISSSIHIFLIPKIVFIMGNNKAKAQFKFQVNNSLYETDIECPTSAQILKIAGFNDPSCYDLILVRRGKDELIKNDQSVCLTDPGVERFRARPKKVKDGFQGGESPLPLRDVEYLNEEFPNRWKIVSQDNLKLLKIEGFDPPNGYNQKAMNMIIIIPKRYDSVQLDMAYFQPHLSRLDGKAIPKATDRKFGSDIYQQWSRHRENDNPWTIGVDCIETHVELIRFFLRKELER
ncbi:multiubiquitin domain-containing protein [Ekhidna sp.]|uniref:multiubiquitin domain-containing protein n=1 Tax=Ekhidna sp. TaxID=2608089 RepID=UPI0032990C56